MNKRDTAKIAVIGSVALAFAGWLTFRAAGVDAPVAELAGASALTGDPVAAQFEWDAGDHRSWRLHVRGDSSTRLDLGHNSAPGAADAIVASFELNARLHQQVVERSADGSAHVRLWLEDVVAAELRMQGQELGNTASLSGELARAGLDLRLDRCGRQVEILGADTASLGAQILQSVAELALPVVCGDAGEAGVIARHVTPNGEAVDTIRTAPAGSTLEVSLEARGYASLRVDPAGEARQVVDADAVAVVRDGQLDSYTLREELEALGARVTLLSAQTTVSLDDPQDHAAIALSESEGLWRSPGTRVATDGAVRSLLERRAASLSGETLVQTLATYGGSGTVPNHNDFLWRAPARLELEPGLSDELAALAMEPDYTSAGRGLVLDVLAQTPTPDAAFAVMAVLQSEAVRADRLYPILLQRVGFVADPPVEMVEWMTALATGSADFNERTSARYSLGSLVSSLDAADRGDEGEGAHRALAQALNEASTPEERVHGLRALANAARASDLATFGDYLDDPSDDVRAAVAASLSGFAVGPATDTLVALAADANDDVQRAAIAALRDHELDEAQLEALAEIAVNGALADRNAGPLLDLAKYYVSSYSGAVVMLADAVSRANIDGVTTAAAIELRRRATPPAP